VVVVVLTFDAERHVDACLGSLARLDAAGLDAAVLVVDNGSGDGTVAAVRARFPAVELLETGRNLGFAGGNDAGIEAALARGADWVYLLNQDTDVDPAFLAEAVAVGEADPGAAAVQSLLLLHPERGLVNTAGNQIHFLGFGHCGGYRSPRAAVADEAREIPFASGAAVLLRAEALRQVGLLDPVLFLYQEDQDLGLRLRLAGWRARLAPRSLVWHHYAFSRNPGKYFWLERNRHLVLLKNLRLRSLLVLAPMLLVAEVAVLGLALAGGWLGPKLRADAALLSPRLWAHVRAERARVAALRRIPDSALARWFTPALELEGLPGGWLPRLLRAPMALAWRLVRPLLG
jgi:N-acetylglucosaminyl-diphospho-decaprenol L-rhamnosyltransferase